MVPSWCLGLQALATQRTRLPLRIHYPTQHSEVQDHCGGMDKKGPHKLIYFNALFLGDGFLRKD
ncbi:mCG147428 [Mus musculus]|nr:mCG147428 [Mus musculus]